MVFRHKAATPSRKLPHPVITDLMSIGGPWDVSFPAKWGAPPKITLDNPNFVDRISQRRGKILLRDGNLHEDIDAPRDGFPAGSKIILDLGKVREIAEVSVNGKPLGILWKPPFESDVTKLLTAGKNHLEIKVTNLWPNRIIGDQYLPPEQRFTFTVYQAYKKDSPLLESGLLGPVRLFALTTH